jgi:hypothetical protein
MTGIWKPTRPKSTRLSEKVNYGKITLEILGTPLFCSVSLMDFDNFDGVVLGTPRRCDLQCDCAVGCCWLGRLLLHGTQLLAFVQGRDRHNLRDAAVETTEKPWWWLVNYYSTVTTTIFLYLLVILCADVCWCVLKMVGFQLFPAVVCFVPRSGTMWG